MHGEATQAAIEATRAWVEHVVIGHGLCPFASAPFASNSLRIVGVEGDDADQLTDAMYREMQLLLSLPADKVETTLIVIPDMLHDFSDFQDFLDVTDALLKHLDAEDELQVAQFHPNFCFEGEAEGARSHSTNRSPYPTYHLLRQSSVERAKSTFDDPAEIYERNIRHLEGLSAEQWKAFTSYSRRDPKS